MKYPLPLNVDELNLLRFHVHKLVERKETDEVLARTSRWSTASFKDLKNEIRDPKKLLTTLEAFAGDIRSGKVEPLTPPRRVRKAAPMTSSD